MANRIPVTKANDMMTQYMNYMTSLGVTMTNQTQMVIFPTTDLMAYLNDTKGYTDEFRICLGAYAAVGNQPPRISTIIWPYKNGQPAYKTTDLLEGKGGSGGGTLLEPFNEGGLLP